MNLAAFLLQELMETSGAIDKLLENEGIIEFMVGESDNLTPWEYRKIISNIPGLNSAGQLLSDDPLLLARPRADVDTAHAHLRRLQYL